MSIRDCEREYKLAGLSSGDGVSLGRGGGDFRAVLTRLKGDRDPLPSCLIFANGSLNGLEPVREEILLSVSSGFGEVLRSGGENRRAFFACALVVRGLAMRLISLDLFLRVVGGVKNLFLKNMESSDEGDESRVVENQRT